MRLVEVEWLDAHVSTSCSTLKKALKTKPVRTYTVGWLMAETGEGLTLCTDCYPDSPKEGRIINHIPWGMIVDWWEYGT